MLTATKDGITLSSTTATQEVLDKAVGVKPEVTPASSSAATGAEGVAQAETVSDSELDNQPESEEVKKHKGGWQRRIDKLTKNNSTLEETLKEERLARQRLEAQLAGKPAATAVEPNANAAGADTEPDENGLNPKTGKPWKDWKEFNVEHTRWVMRQEGKAAEAAKSQTADQAELQKNLQAHTDRLKAAQTKYPDWNEVAESLNKEEIVPEGVSMALIELDNGPDVIYHLAKNPEVLKEIRGMSELKAIAKVGAISDKLAGEATAAAAKAASGKGAKPNSSPEKKTVTSSAPDPITPVGGGSSATTVDRSKMSTTDWIKQRNAGQIK